MVRFVFIKIVIFYNFVHHYKYIPIYVFYVYPMSKTYKSNLPKLLFA